MKELNLPFWIGMDYEELEFELEVLPDRIEGYDSYLYLGKFNNFLNDITDRTELLYSMDVLEGIIVNIPILNSEKITAQLESISGNPQVIVYNATFHLIMSNSNLFNPIVYSIINQI